MVDPNHSHFVNLETDALGISNDITASSQVFPVQDTTSQLFLENDYASVAGISQSLLTYPKNSSTLINISPTPPGILSESVFPETLSNGIAPFVVPTGTLPGIPLVPPIPIANPSTLLSTSVSSSSLPVYNSGTVASSTSANLNHLIQAPPVLKTIDVCSDDPSLIYKPAEDMMGGQMSTTAFIGSIAEGISDDLIQRLLEICGRVTKWKRPLDPSGKFKPFGFCDFMQPDGILRALRILPNLQLKGKQLTVKADENTKSNLKRYEGALKGYLQTRPHIPDHSAFDPPAKEAISELLKTKNIPFFWNDPNAPTSIPQVIENTSTKSDTFKSKNSNTSQQVEFDSERELENRRRAIRELERIAEQENERKEAQYRDRLKRWRNKEEAIFREYHRFLEDEKKEIIRQASLKTDHEGVITLHHDYSTFIAKDLFFLDRELWRSNRRKLLIKEHELLSEDDISFIRSELDKIISLSLFEDRLYKNTNLAIHPGNRTSKRSLKQFHNEDNEEGSNNYSDGFYHDRQRSSRYATKISRMSILKQQMGANLPECLTADELIAAGMSSEEAMQKSLSQQKNRLELLVKALPTEKNDVFDYDVFWVILDEEKVFYSTTLPLWLSKKLPEILDTKSIDTKPFTEAILYSIKSHKNPFKLVSELTFLLEGNENDDADNGGYSSEDERDKATFFVLKLWRFVILESERLLLSRE